MFSFLFVVIILSAIASAVDGCFMSMPREFHRVHPKLIWAIVSSCAMVFAATFFAEKIPLAAQFLVMGALAIYIVFRGIAYFGLSASFRTYSLENGVYMSPFGPIVTWAAGLLDVVGIAMLFVHAVVHTIETGQMTASEKVDFGFFLSVIFTAGLFVSAAYLLTMNSNRNKVVAFERAERKKKMDAILLERKKQRTAGSASSI